MIDANDIPSSQLILYADDGYDSHVVRLLLEEKSLLTICLVCIPSALKI